MLEMQMQMKTILIKNITAMMQRIKGIVTKNAFHLILGLDNT